MEIFKKELIQFKKNVSNWKEAIQIASEPLIINGYVNKNFVPKLILETERLGPYYIMVENLALGHITPDGSAFKNGISLLFLDEPIPFKEDGSRKVKFLFILSAIDQETHLSLLQEMALAFGNINFYKEFYNVKQYDDIVKLVDKYLITKK